MKFSLFVMTPGKQEGKAIEVKLSQFLVGRDPQCHLRPASPMISKRHCALIQRDGKAFIRDFDSTNGTQVNDQPIDGEVELHHNDKLKIGPLLFTVRIEQDAPKPSAPVSRPTPAPPTKAALASKAPAQAPPPAKRPVAPSTPTPPPATVPAPSNAETETDVSVPAPAASKSAAGEDEEDIAAMLLSLEGESPTTASGSHGPLPEIPDGSTVMDLKVPAELAAQQPAEAVKGGTEKAREKAKGDGNTSNAAKNLLEKMMKRPRQQP